MSTDGPKVTLDANGGKIAERTITREMADQVKADVVNISQGGANEVDARTVNVRMGGIGQAQADDITIEQGGIVQANATSASVNYGGIVVAGAEDISVNQGGVAVAVTSHAELKDSRVGLLLAGTVEGDVQAAIDTRGALTMGLGIGLVLVAANVLRRLFANRD